MDYAISVTTFTYIFAWFDYKVYMSSLFIKIKTYTYLVVTWQAGITDQMQTGPGLRDGTTKCEAIVSGASSSLILLDVEGAELIGTANLFHR